MNNRIKHVLRVIAILTAIVILNLNTTDAVKAAVPGLYAPVTQKNVLELMKKYDKSSYLVLKAAESSGDDILHWWRGGGAIFQEIDTAVHEETHHLVHAMGGYDYSKSTWKYAYPIDNGKYIYVSIGKIYNTQKMASSVPSNLRTFRFSTYVSKPSSNMSSNVKGCYGLMNEWCAYYNGMRAGTSLYDYYNQQGGGMDQYIIDGGNGKQAYAEFRYYILHYLYYAKKHYPAVYKDVMKNKAFCKAYKTIDKKYKKLIKKYDARKHIAGSMTDYTYDEYDDSYNKLMNEMKKKHYQKIHNALYAKG